MTEQSARPQGFGRGPGPGRMMGGPVEKPKHFKKTLLTIFQYLKPHKVNYCNNFCHHKYSIYDYQSSYSRKCY
jgi:hypothetical protein